MIALTIALGALIGLAMGALGAGGSILAVPVLVHITGLAVPAATATSLVAVGAAAAVAAWGHRQHIDRTAAVGFVAIGGVGSLVGAAIADRLSDDAVLGAFSVVVLIAAHRMLTACPSCTKVGEAQAVTAGTTADAPAGRAAELGALVGAGLLVGSLTGLFGVGGGFVVVPVLTLVMGHSLRTAVATSLVVVAGNAALAILTRGTGSVDWPVALALTAPLVVGSFVGARAAHRLDPQRSLRAFAAMLVAVAIANAATVVL